MPDNNPQDEHLHTGTGWPDAEADDAVNPAADSVADATAEAPDAETDGAGADEAAVDEAGVDEAGADEVATADAAGTAAKRVSAAGMVIGLLLGLLGFAFVVQLRSRGTDADLEAARPDDLVRILYDLDSRADRLRREISDLEESERQLTSGARGREAAIEEARRRADALGILAGTLAAQGSGLQVRFEGKSEALRASRILDAVEELRGAGAEAMQISGSGGEPVRIVAATYFTDEGADLNVDGEVLTGPYTIVVIGDPQTMATALNIPGGVVDQIHEKGGNVIIQSSVLVQVTALRQVTTPRYAKPGS